MRNEATEEMLVFTTEVCWKYEQVKTIVEGAEASWKQNLEMAATSKYSGEKEMYDQQAAEDFSRYTAAKEWLKLVDGAVAKVREKKARLVLKQNCFAGVTMKSILLDKKTGTYMSRSTATRYGIPVSGCKNSRTCGAGRLGAFVPRLRYHRTEPEEEHAGSGVGDLGKGRREPRPL